MTTSLDLVRALAKDLRAGAPRSPRDAAIGGFVIAARALDKCRAHLCGIAGEYNWDCPLDKRFFEFAGIDAAAFSECVASGADDAAVSAWVGSRTARTREEIVLWNNRERDRRLSDLSPKSQVYMEDYVKQHLPPGRIVYHYFDIYDLEEGRL